jgi:hypothetical protein
MAFLKKLFSKQNERSLDQVIFDIAEYGNRECDLKELYNRLPGLEIYSKIAASNIPLKDGQSHIISVNENLSLFTVKIQNEFTLIQFFINKADPRLEPEFISMDAMKALEMTLKSANVDGIAICNSKESWVALQKPEIQNICNHHMR